MEIVLDLILLAVLVLMTVIGVKRGFIKSAVRLIGFVAAVAVAAIVSGPLAVQVYDRFVAEPLEAAVTEKVAQGVAATAATVSEQVTKVIESLPEMLQGILSVYGVGEVTADAAVSSEQLTSVMMDQVLRPICESLIQVIVFLVLFLVLFIVIHLLGGLLDKLFASLPVIKQANGLLGGVIGFAEGALIVFVLSFALQLYMTFAGADSLVTTGDIGNTYLLRFVMEWNPML